jgi:hypothetical protein
MLRPFVNGRTFFLPLQKIKHCLVLYHNLKNPSHTQRHFW